MRCSRCSIDLAKGSAHVSESGCIEALQEALQKATECRACGGEVVTVLHAGCLPAEIVNRGAKLGTGVIEKKLGEWLAKKISGEESPEGGDEPRKRWRP